MVPKGWKSKGSSSTRSGEGFQVAKGITANFVNLVRILHTSSSVLTQAISRQVWALSIALDRPGWKIYLGHVVGVLHSDTRVGDQAVTGVDGIQLVLRGVVRTDVAIDPVPGSPVLQEVHKAGARRGLAAPNVAICTWVQDATVCRTLCKHPGGQG